jgi:CubicO group peptidase (beta-lactamase class C family)
MSDISTIKESVTTGTVEGSCHARFDEVRQEFVRNFQERDEVGASVSITFKGETVVDLWGGSADPTHGLPWTRDTLCLIWSSTKGATSLCAHLLMDRGQLDINAPVARYWPEFAQEGKEAITVKMVLSHQSGVAAISEPLPQGAFFDWDLMIHALERQKPFWQPGTRHGYHSLTYGWLVGELVRLV